jgi:hypothetical protein
MQWTFMPILAEILLMSLAMWFVSCPDPLAHRLPGIREFYLSALAGC